MSLFTVVTKNNAYQLPSRKLIVGLGNIGDKYIKTRHNMGFLAVDRFVARYKLPVFSIKSDLNCMLSEGQIEDAKVLVAKPTTMMNRSGRAVLQLQNYFELGIDQILVVHDDIDLQFGDIRTKVGGSSGGHNGINSIDNSIGEDYARVRLGVADEHRAKQEASDYVLKTFPKAQLSKLDVLFEESNQQIIKFIDGSLK